MSTRRVAVLDTVDTLDLFTTTSVERTARNLRAGMVLMCPDLGTPLLWLDHRTRSQRGTGDVTFLAHNLETGAIKPVHIHANKTVHVLAA